MSVSSRTKTHRDCSSKLPWNNLGAQDDEMLLDDSDDEDYLNVKTVTMTPQDVSADEYLQKQFAEASNLWTDEDVRAMTEDVQEKGVDWWIRHYIGIKGYEPRNLLLAFGLLFSKDMGEPSHDRLFKILKMTLMRIVRRRERLLHYNTIQDVVALLRKCNKVMVLSGAGISVSSGIPDFRSKNGLYQMLKSANVYELDDPQQMFDLEFFKGNPRVFYSFAKEIYPSNHEPSLAHHFIRLLEKKGKLLRNYTQNIDDLESSAGIQKVLQCHGSFSKATCLACKIIYPGHAIEADVLAQRVPLCKLCRPPPLPPLKRKKKKPSNVWKGGDETSESEPEQITKSIIKPNITFFGEKLTDDFDKFLRVDRQDVDLLIVMGTSLKVTPVSEILSHIPHSVPQILINKTAVKHMNADVVLLGNADSVIEYLCNEALGPGWELPKNSNQPSLKKRKSSPSFDFKPTSPRRVGNSHVWLFEGAEGGDLVANIETQAKANGMNKLSVDGRQTKKAKAV